MTSISKYTLAAYALLSSPLAGIGFLGYILYTDKKIKNLENQIKASISENEEPILNNNLESVIMSETATNFEGYENCIIENYHNRFYRIIKPSGEYLPKIFITLGEAKREIDAVTPFLKKTEHKRSNIYNVRYVK